MFPHNISPRSPQNLKLIIQNILLIVAAVLVDAVAMTVAIAVIIVVVISVAAALVLTFVVETEDAKLSSVRIPLLLIILNAKKPYQSWYIHSHVGVIGIYTTEYRRHHITI